MLGALDQKHRTLQRIVASLDQRNDTPYTDSVNLHLESSGATALGTLSLQPVSVSMLTLDLATPRLSTSLPPQTAHGRVKPKVA
jgi:hypothetical protein